MWQLSEQTQQLLVRLARLDEPRLWFGRQKRTEQVIAVLQDVAESGEPAALPAIMRFVFARSAEVQIAAHQAVDRLISCVPFENLLHLSEHVRRSWRWDVSEEWRNFSPGIVSSLAIGTRPATSVLGLASFHPSGYVRHQAVRLLAEVRGGSELPYLLIRQNDWV
ncbi:MAG: hypothetical protein KY475_10150, partial [Planctomycetes bacterium]|nr:hypothetical protein [Planctomycetota bacterium]